MSDRIPFRFFLWFVVLVVLTGAPTAFAEDAQALLKAADRFRMAADAVEVRTRIRLYKDDVLDKERRYDVFLKPGRRSLVLFRHPSERGQKMLMLDDRFWMIMPKSRRPIRVTPMQKLLGEASAGDIATMTWSTDYRARIDGETVVDGIAALKLELTASRKGATYKRIDLWIAAGDSHPLKADLYVHSGKLAKQVTFRLGAMDGRPAVVSMTLLDKVQKNRRTVIDYLANRPRAIDDRYYNPMYLVRNTLDALSEK